MKALLALGLCLAWTVPSLAQDDKKEVDSVYITPFAGARIILVGKGMEKLLKENNLEVLKNKFIQDYQESAKDKDFPATAKNIIYLAGADGKRRLKAIPDEVAPVNVKEEIKAFNSNLPPFHYTIYDLMKDYQYHIYLNGPEELDKLKAIDCIKLIAGAKKEKNQLGIKWARSTEIVPVDTVYFFKNFKGGHPDRIALATTMGIGLINSSFSPNLGADFYFERVNKYGQPNYQIGVSFSSYILANYENKSFTSFYPISSYSLFYLKNYGSTGLGLSVGKFLDGTGEPSVNHGSLNKAWKVGIISQYSKFGLEYNFIFDKQKKTNTAFTLRYYF